MSDKVAYFEPICGVIRVRAPNTCHGADASWCASVRFVSLTEVEILGATTAPTGEEWKAVLNALSRLGVDNVFYRRYKGGTAREYRYTSKQVIGWSKGTRDA